MDLKKLSTIDWIISVAAALLVIDLVALPWYDFHVGSYGVYSYGVSFTGVEAPDGFFAWLAVLIGLAIIAQVVIAKLTTVELPQLGLSWGKIKMIGGLAALGLVLLKFVLNLHPHYFGIGCWVAVVLSAALAYGGLMASKEALA